MVSVLFVVPVIPLDRNISRFKILKCLGGPIPQLGLGLSTGGSPYRLYVNFLSIPPKVVDIGSWESFASLESGIL